MEPLPYSLLIKPTTTTFLIEPERLESYNNILKWVEEHSFGKVIFESGFLQCEKELRTCSLVSFENKEDCIYFKFVWLHEIIEWPENGKFKKLFA